MTSVPTQSPVPAWGTSNAFVELRAPGGPLTGEQLADRELIRETVARYGWAYDERREDVLGACFAEDATFTATIAGATDMGPFEGRAAIVEMLKGVWETQTDQRRHCVLNLIIDDLTADRATVHCYIAVTAAENGVARLMMTGFYRNRMSKADGVWRIAEFFGGFDTEF